MISGENGIGNALGGNGGIDIPSSTARSFCACNVLLSSSLTRFSSSFLLYDAANSAYIFSCSALDAATLSCSARIISRTCAIVTAPSSPNGAGDVCLVLLIFSAKTLRNFRNFGVDVTTIHREELLAGRIVHESGLRELVNRSVIGDSLNPLRA